MSIFENVSQWILGFVLILSSLGVILAAKPVHASLSFLLSLVALAALYLQLSAQFIAAMQILVYAGAILVIFIFVIVLFQDAHEELSKYKPQSTFLLLLLGALGLVGSFILIGYQLLRDQFSVADALPQDFGTVQALGKALYIDFFFPFEAVTFLFLIAVVGALYIGKKVEQ